MKNNIRKTLISCALATTMLFSYVAAGCQFTNSGNSGNNGPKYTVTFNFGDGSRDAKKTVSQGSALATGNNPSERDGYTFVGWATSATSTDIIAFPYTPTGDITLYAVWEAATYTVTFDMNYEGSTPATEEVEYGQEVNAPATDPVRDGYVFYGWNNKAENGTLVEFPYEVKSDVTFYANWLSAETSIYTVSFEYNYQGAPEEELKTLNVVEGGSILSNKTPPVTRDGYELLGWATKANSSTTVTFPYKPTADTVLYAVWRQKTYKIAFKSNFIDAPNSGLIEERANVPSGELVYAPVENPVRSGYTFDGWYTDAKGGTKVDFTNGVKASKNLSYFAHWISDAVETNIFQAEYTYFNPNDTFPGYSGAVSGAMCIQHSEGGEAVEGVYVPAAGADESNSRHTTDHGHFVGSLYGKGITLTFEIYSTTDVSNATLKVSLSSELAVELAMTPEGPFGYLFKVNGTSLDYSITLSATDGEKLPFQEYTVSTNVSLQAGLNKIELVTNNTTNVGGTMAGAAPMIDYIKLENTGSTVLSYHPIYDNLWSQYL